MSVEFDDRAPWDFTDVTPGDPVVPPDAQWDGHDDGDPLTEEQVRELVGPDPEPAAAPGDSGGTVALTEDWLAVPPDRARELADALRAGLLARVRSMAAAGAAARTVSGRRPSSSDLLAEAQVMARAHGMLDDLAKLFTDVRKESAALLSDAVVDHLGRKSAKVATPDGGLVSVALAAASTSISVDEDVVLDILGTALIAAEAGESGDRVDFSFGYAAGVRAGVVGLRGLLGKTPGWTITKLDALVVELQKADEGPLAARLSGAYAKVERGEPTAKLTVEYGEGS